jgi:hypothetical protein
VVLADAEEVNANLVGKDALLDDVTDRLCVRFGLTVLVVRPVAERVKPENERELLRLASISERTDCA